ncbi:P27 family phage terminase small subunit, partial [Escherichia coli]
MTLSFFITVIPDHDKPQPPGCLLDARALELLVEAYTEYRHHCETLDVEGYTYRTETQSGDVLIKAHPAAAMKADAWK